MSRKLRFGQKNGFIIKKRACMVMLPNQIG